MAQTLRMNPGDLAGGAASPAGAPGEEPQQAPRSERSPQRARRCPQCRQTFSWDARFCPFDGATLVDAPDWTPSADPLLGKTVDGRYEVLSLLGEGGMGTVYEVRHATLGRTFAMKVLRRDIARDPELVARFALEAKAAAGIGHPNIVTVSDFGVLELGSKEPNRPYFVMELLEGMSLGALLRAEKRVSPARVAPLFIQCARALEAAHNASVIHRDLKPDNIFILKKGDEEVVKLLDFGVAKIAGSRRLTRVGMVFGTPHYMSPEQAEGKQVDARTDIYALGVIMYECFSGKVPFEADTYMGVLTKHMFAVPEPIERVTPDASALGAFGPIVMRCLAKRPEERYASMGELAEAITLALTNPQKAAAAGIMDERPKGAALRLRDRDAMLGPVHVPEGVKPPISRAARVSIALAAVVVPIAVALGLRALRSPAAAPSSASSETSSANAGPRANDPRSAPDPATSAPQGEPPAAAPTGAPSSAASTQVAAVRSATQPGPPTPGATSPSSTTPPRGATGASGAKPPTGGGDIVDPWRK